MPEYRSLFDLPPSVLSRGDLLALAQLLEDGVPLNPHSVEYTAKKGEVSYQAKNIDELLNQLPADVDELELRVRGWAEDNAIDRGFSIRLHAIVSSCQIHSADEIWYRGKLAQINEFFSVRRPWYGSVRPYLAALSGISQPALLMAATNFGMKGKYALSAVSEITLSALVIATNSFIKGRILPQSRIELVQRSSWLTKDGAMVIFTALGAIATLAGVIV